MNNKLKIFKILNAIEDASLITPKGKPIRIDVRDDNNLFFLQIKSIELDYIFEKLSNENVIKLLKGADIIMAPVFIFTKNLEYKNDRFCYFFKKYKNFDKYFNNLKKELSYSEKIETINAEGKYEIFYDERVREITVNKIYTLAKPDFDNENELFFRYIFKHPNQRLLIKDIENEIGQKLGKDIHAILNNLGFRVNFKKAFFNNASQTSIIFKNPVTKEDLKVLGIDKLIE